MLGPSLTDGVVRLREWALTDAEWYAATAAHDDLIQRFTTESPSVTAEDVRAAITALAGRAETWETVAYTLGAAGG